MSEVINAAGVSHVRETVNSVICGAGTWETVSTNRSELGRDRDPYHSEGLFCICLHGKQARFNFLIPRQRRLKFDPDGDLFITGAWGLVSDVHTLRKQTDETIR